MHDIGIEWIWNAPNVDAGYIDNGEETGLSLADIDQEVGLAGGAGGDPVPRIPLTRGKKFLPPEFISVGRSTVGHSNLHLERRGDLDGHDRLTRPNQASAR